MCIHLIKKKKVELYSNYALKCDLFAFNKSTQHFAEQISDLEKKISALESENSLLEKLSSELQKNLQEMSDHVTQQSLSIVDLKSENASLKSASDSLEKEHKNNITNLHQFITELETKITGLESQNLDKDLEIKNLKEKADAEAVESGRSLDAKNEEIFELKDELSSHTTEFESSVSQR